MRREKSESWLRRLAAVESPDVTFQGENFPIVMRRGRGLHVTDVDGNGYLDFTACFGVLALGHRHPAVVTASRRQTARLMHGMGDVHPTESKVRLLEKLVAMAPIPGAKALLGLNGADAIDAALKTAMLVTGRDEFVSFSGGYHGLTLGPLGLCDRDHFRAGFAAWLGDRFSHIPFPAEAELAPGLCAGQPPDVASLSRHGLVSAEKALEILENRLKTGRVAAVVAEPLQGRGGEREWPAGFWKSCEYLCRKHGTLIIFDEIFTGLGRTGALWGHEALGVRPDILCVGKALGGGFPLSACVSGFLDVWGRSTGEARHTATFLGHPLACAAGRTVLDVISRDLSTWQKEWEACDRALRSFLIGHSRSGAAARFPVVLRGRGLMRGLWFHQADPGFAATLAEELLHQGFLVLPSGPRGDVLSLTPPLIVQAKQFEALLTAVEKLLVAKL